jgi:hypothetical protein
MTINSGIVLVYPSELESDNESESIVLNPALVPFLRDICVSGGYSHDSAGYTVRELDIIDLPGLRAAGASYVSYSEIKPLKNTAAGLEFFEIPFCTWGDYCGSTVERSNHRVISDDYKDQIGVNIWPIIGGYGSYGLLCSVELYAADNDLRDIINGLFDYPLVNEDDHSALEFELESEDWDSWIKGDLRRALAAAGLRVPVKDSTLLNRFRIVCEVNNIYPEFESAVSCYIDLDSVVSGWRSWRSKAARRGAWGRS